MRVYVDSLAVYFTFSNSINAVIWMNPGSHTLTVMAEDKKGCISTTIIHVNISSQPPTIISDIQNMSGWLSLMRRYLHGLAAYYSFTNEINQFIWMPQGEHTIEVTAEDTAGYIATATVQVNVVSQELGVSYIQNF